MKKLLQEKIGIYASPSYLKNHATLKNTSELMGHSFIHFDEGSSIDLKNINWQYTENKKKKLISISPSLITNDIASSLLACESGVGLARFTETNSFLAVSQNKLIPVLGGYDWGDYYLFAIYPEQKVLPRRTRLFLDYISGINYSNRISGTLE